MMYVVILCFLLVIGYLMCRKPRTLPPGAWGLPIIGVFPPRGKSISEVVKDFKLKYGDIYTWRFGGQTFVILSDYNLIKEAFNKPELQGRPDFYSKGLFSYDLNAGIVLSDGELWKENRRFALRHLREFGLGRSSLDFVIQQEAQLLVQDFKTQLNVPIGLDISLNVAVLNVVWKLVADRHYDIHDKEIRFFTSGVNENIEVLQGFAGLLDIFPWLSTLLPSFVIEKWMKINIIRKNMDIFKIFVLQIIMEHQNTLDAGNPRDYIDAYLMEKEAQKKLPGSHFRHDLMDLVVIISDLFAAGTETTSSTLRWVVLFMALHTDIQDKVQCEIDAVVDRDTPLTYQDRERMPFTEAVLLEVQRVSSLLPLGVSHLVTEDVQLAGFVLPKDTIVVASIENCHQSPKYWEKPDEFYPGHFLDAEGKVIFKKEGFLPFSIGRRQCLGESLARMELFLFTTMILQKFTIRPPKGVELSTKTDKTKPLFNFVEPYKVVLTERK